MAEQDKSQKTEQPTARRLDKARERGQVPRSTEVPGALVLAAFLIYAEVFGGAWLTRLRGYAASSLGGLDGPDLTLEQAVAVLGAAGAATASLLLAPLGVMVAAGIAGNLLQSRPVFTLKPFQPDVSKVNPFKGIKKVFALKKWIDTLKALIKMALYSAVAVWTIREALLEGIEAGGGADGALLALMALSAKVLMRVLMLAAALAVLDYLFRRYDHVRGLKMTKKEIKDERKETEGDPHVRARVRSKQLALARSRMMADVEKATVVVTNPTRFAVAIRYVPGEMDVPKVLAKGRGRIAERIREIATARRIPIVSDPPLARLLYRKVPVGGEIPIALYLAVAEVLALVFRRRDTRRARPRGSSARL